MTKCVWCGRRKRLFEQFNKYGFCPECKNRVRQEIEDKIADVNDFIILYKGKTLKESDDKLNKFVDRYLSTLDELEKIREKVPMFKSSTGNLRNSLLEIRHEIESRVRNVPPQTLPPKTEPNPLTEPNSLTVPKKIDNFELRYLYRDVFVIGVFHADTDFKDLHLRDRVELVPDPKNEHDKWAVKVMRDHQHVGYLASKMETLQHMVHDWKRKGEPIFSAITSLNEDEKKINVVIGFYRDEQEILAKCETLTAKLSKTNKKDDSGDSRQENLQCLRVGDVLYAEYDWDTETYLITDECCSEMGELSKSISAHLQGVDEERFPYVIVDDISEDEDCKRTVRVKIYLKPRIK